MVSHPAAQDRRRDGQPPGRAPTAAAGRDAHDRRARPGGRPPSAGA